ncbi:MAG TPA: DUF1707 domain-containing protein [Actinophytocola sp.]|uniref:DUF1707 SHOCT-like domain-containing protein n=1 Tax=Actinophytocola sp. TaxID=1872138 RepID=UPI002DDC95B7|nr:DUF1707 domain-containing protein [Actinophytocola sp.]HEV2779930.1 DUF1707 domain-containing protein [Actinophytocola sp.]
MTTNTLAHDHNVRASDAEREEVARIVQDAGAEGRLTLAETEERLAGIYGARFRHELAQYTADLPRERDRPQRPWPPGVRGVPRPLLVHGALAIVLATVLIVRWIVSGVPYFWPGFPLFWLAVSLFVHARIRGFRGPYRRARAS